MGQAKTMWAIMGQAKDKQQASTHRLKFYGQGRHWIRGLITKVTMLKFRIPILKYKVQLMIDLTWTAVSVKRSKLLFLIGRR